MFLSYALHIPDDSRHNLFLFRRMGPANEIHPVMELQFDFCIPTHSVHPAQQDLFATGAPAGRFELVLPLAPLN